MNENPTIYQLTEGCTIAVTFRHEWMTTDPRNITTTVIGDRSITDGNQKTTICIIRPLEGRRLIYTGTTVQSPDDREVERIGDRIAFERALAQMLPDLSPQQISHVRRKAIFDKQEAELMAMSTLPEDVYQTA